jgi:NDP-hexose-3-ketoreductase
MKSILFIGYSNVLKARVFPFIDRLGLDSISIAKYSGQEWDDKYKDIKTPIKLYDSYDEGLKNFRGDLVYISIVNSEHFNYAKKSLEAGFNTIVDKPATSTLIEAEELVRIAKDKNLLIGVSTVYLNHPQMALIKSIFDEYSDKPKLLTVHFTMPPFRMDNFRYKKELGGGAISDTAPYASSICRFLFEDEPIAIKTIINETNQDNLDIEYSLIMKFPKGRCMIGHFGFDTEYINNITIMGQRLNVSFDRVFTIPETMENTLHTSHLNIHKDFIAKKGNTFMNYLSEVLNNIDTKKFNIYYNDILYDAKVKDMINNNKV